MAAALGLRTVIYHVPDLERAKQWYSGAFGVTPYFDEPFYVGFNVGGYELGLDPDDSIGPEGPGGVFVYWGVPDCAAALERLKGMGAKVHKDLQDVGGGIKVATVYDPFGNVFGIIENPSFAEGSRR